MEINAQSLIQELAQQIADQAVQIAALKAEKLALLEQMNKSIMEDDNGDGNAST